MSMLTVDLSTEKAEHIRATVAPNAQVEFWGAQSGVQTVALGRAARDCLESLPEDADGHLGADGVLWIGGTPYPCDVIA